MLGKELQTPVNLMFGPPFGPEPMGEPWLDYFSQLQEHLRKKNELTQATLSEAGARQQPAYDSGP